MIDRPPQSFRALSEPPRALARAIGCLNEAASLANQARAGLGLSHRHEELNLSSTGLRNPDGSWKTN